MAYIDAKRITKKDINELFLKIIDDIDSIMYSDFYKEKESLLKVKEIIKNWHKDFQNNNKITTIKIPDLEYIGLEIVDIFDRYISTESVKDNFVERLMFDFSVLEEVWKQKMLGDEKNV